MRIAFGISISIDESLLSPPSTAHLASNPVHTRARSYHDCQSTIHAISNNWNVFDFRSIYRWHLHNCGTSRSYRRRHFQWKPPTSPVLPATVVSDSQKRLYNFSLQHTKRPARPIYTRQYEWSAGFGHRTIDFDDVGHNSKLQCRYQ